MSIPLCSQHALLTRWGGVVVLPCRPGKYVRRWAGRKPQRRPSLASRRVPLWVVATSLVGSFLGIFLVGLLDDFLYSPGDVPLNLVGGHALSSFIGVSCHKLFAHVSMPLAAALAVSISIAVMQLTCTLHPPGGASAIIAVLASGKVVEAGYYYVVTTVLGALVMLAVALAVNNLPRPPNLRHAPPLRPKNK
ncbi:HPP family protein [Acanthamoeba castellanii str. Neff]|uniref:HPP family protein n=1 Tax=Acanthamoeba castellanii (strain ATCC 30010 / Neff) TaxID=1257118 RepID=L8GCW9_ACACF|nr:HPP family protein [Acanthamoeba castellanii str. Neff]ELR11010.1 HPP family protein [Acanthamoeba castellanii str. Neff]